jgi:hypothetical protein
MPRHPTAAYQLATENLDKIHARLASARRLGCPTSWYKSFDFHIPQETDDRVELDERATWFYEAVTSTTRKVWSIRHLAPVRST